MHTRLIRRASTAAAAVATLLGGALAGPATAAPTHWVYDSDILTTSATWTSLGHRPGLLGNAHSGELFLETDEGPALIEADDWSCPAGVRPPNDSLTETSCTLLRNQFINAPAGVFEGPLQYHVKGATEVATQVGDGDVVSSTGSVDLTFVRTGPISRSTRVSDDLKVVTLSAPMRMSGSLGATRFADPALTQSVSPYNHALYYVQG